MELSSFFEILKRYLNCNPARAVCDFFEYGKAKGVPSESSARMWFKGKRNLKLSSYFDNDNQPDKDGIVLYLQLKINTNWKKLQNDFNDIKDFDIVDRTTGDSDVFFESLCYQFFKIIGYDIPNDFWEKNKSKYNTGFEETKKIAESCSSIANTHKSGNSSGEILHKANDNTSVSKIHINPELKCCLFCCYWNGNFHDGLTVRDGVNGKCKVHGKIILSVLGKDCDRFDFDLGRVTRYEIETKFLK